MHTFKMGEMRSIANTMEGKVPGHNTNSSVVDVADANEDEFLINTKTTVREDEEN